MAPDLNAVSAGGKWDYSAPGAKGYDIPDITMNDPGNRKIRVICMGAGVSGILTAYQISKYCQNVNLNIYEKNEDIGGTWLENRYPGCACDIPSHAYSYNFALNPDWPRYFSYSPDIWKYLNQICEVCDLRKYMTFNTEAIGCWWQEETGEWLVRFRQTAAGKEVREFEERCDLLVHACGLLNNYKWPDLPGMNKFKGNIYHTAKWPENYQAEQWKNDRVAVIGSGASSIQTVPNMQPHVKHMDVFVRTGVWFVEIANNFGSNKPYSDEEKDTFRHDPTQLTAHAKSIEDQVNGLWGAFYSDSPGQKMVSDLFYKRMAEHIKDERLLKGFTPKFGVGCRRVTPGDPYMKAIQEPNVDVHFTAVKEITENGVIGEDGQERETDTIICATGFDVSYKPRFPLVGKNGVDLKEKWKETPESYLGLAIPDFPNFLSYIGPTWPVENGSVMGPLLTVSEYMVQAIKKMQNENIKSFTPKQDVTDSFNEHAQEFITHTIWKDDCRAWYRNNETGRVNAVWPGSSLHYQHVIESPRWEDFEIERHDKKNMWAWLGLGWTQESVVNMQLVTAAAEHGDSVEGIDERTAKLAINRRPDSHGAAAGEVAGHPVEGGGSKAAVTEDSKPSNPLAPLPAKRVDVSPYLADRNLDFRWLAAHGMDREKAKQFVIDAAAKDAADKKRAEIERMEAGHGGDSASTMGFTNSFI